VPGIGKKTAERLLLELKDKLGAPAHSGGYASAGSSHEDILNALIALGYSSSESQSALKALPADIDVSNGIRQALKSLAR
ncbi:MAG: Holliday junction branch migration protein RuvA, partial [Pusillimonas sp.]|nr:Holliday junction branch migration protein RuvA [Pusillimonas sp.]